MTREPEAIGELLERRWFAANSACTAQRHECESIRQSLEFAEHAWKRANLRLRELEAMRDLLGEALAELDASHERPARPIERQVMTAA